jgi:hypothetical protein
VRVMPPCRPGPVLLRNTIRLGADRGWPVISAAGVAQDPAAACGRWRYTLRFCRGPGTRITARPAARRGANFLKPQFPQKSRPFNEAVGSGVCVACKMWTVITAAATMLNIRIATRHPQLRSGAILLQDVRFPFGPQRSGSAPLTRRLLAN